MLGYDPSILTDPRLLELMPAMYLQRVFGQASRRPTESGRQGFSDNVATPFILAGDPSAASSDDFRQPQRQIHIINILVYLQRPAPN